MQLLLRYIVAYHIMDFMLKTFAVFDLGQHFIEICDCHDAKKTNGTERNEKRESWRITKSMVAVIGLFSIANALAIAFHPKARVTTEHRAAGPMSCFFALEKTTR